MTVSQHWPQTLLNSSVYPHPVAEPELIETHISWVILTGKFAYKIKKPVSMGFLDFSTLERRHYYCERELQLNRRFSEALYLDVVTINGDREHPVINGEGPVIDYAVKMRQFDNRLLADYLARNGQLTDVHIRQMARTLEDFHAGADAGDPQTAGQAVIALCRAIEENFSQMRQYPMAAEIVDSLSDRERWLTESLSRQRELMEQRLAQGFVKDCHGDCHLGNIAIIDGRVTLFDCIEFNDAFRVMDTFAEAAFLSMDLCARQLSQQSQRFLNTYLEYSGDYGALPLLNLYRCYYALVRAKVLLMKRPVEQCSRIDAESYPEFFDYIALSQTFTEQQSPVLVLMHGFSGSGKSWLAEQIVTRTTAVRIRSDVERKRLFELKPEQSGDAIAGLYSREASRRTFSRLLSLAQSVIEAGFTCIVDATFLSRQSREPFLAWAGEQQIPCVILDCRASETTVHSRLKQRTSEASDASDADIRIYEQQKLSAEPFTDQEQRQVVSVDTEVDNVVDQALKYVPRCQELQRSGENDG